MKPIKPIILMSFPVAFLILGISSLLAGFNDKQTIAITGKVMDEAGAPVSFATIAVTGTRNATTADVNGEYAINVDEKEESLTFTATGYDLISIKINGQKVLTQ